jgi:hypothetical protein
MNLGRNWPAVASYQESAGRMFFGLRRTSTGTIEYIDNLNFLKAMLMS